MNVTVTIDSDDKQVLALYVYVREGDIHKTVEVVEGECNVDEDDQGRLLGVELLAPNEIATNLDKLSERYVDGPHVKEVLHNAMALSV